MDELLIAELHARAAIVERRFEIGMTEQAMRDQAELLDITAHWDEHPEAYEGPCACKTCCSYATKKNIVNALTREAGGE